MIYSELKNLALSYSDRENDAELIAKMDSFLLVTEARINRVLKVQKMSIRTQVLTVADQEYYGLPADFAGLRDIEIRADDTSNNRTTLQYLSPEQMNDATKIMPSPVNPQIFYTIIANQLQINPPQDGLLLEIVYYAKLTPLSTSDQTNWMSEDNPDVYLFGLMVEISSFIKNANGKQLWEERFVTALAEIDRDDSRSRWSGSPLSIKKG